jgi:acyl-CoA reductase-like NAD-dependent aldehyde dehydrogenase
MPSRFEEVGAPLEERLGNGLLQLLYHTVTFGEQLHEDALLCLSNHTTMKRASDSVVYAMLPSNMPFWLVVATLVVTTFRFLYVRKRAVEMIDGHEYHEKCD